MTKAAAILLSALSVAAAPLDLETDVDTAHGPQKVVFLERTLEKGQSSGMHIHHGVEMNELLEGTIRLTVGNGAPRIMHEGDSVSIPREVPHEAVNIGDGPARIVITYVVDRDRPLREPWPPSGKSN
ncbi:MAG TPA: cupin domain-containing protein [Rhizomicrobium sp.]|jgi:quercetin dioxygenase-like cupin family protein|nr:cupin domain-containing protein [Rhizomicrobium sp.]